MNDFNTITRNSNILLDLMRCKITQFKGKTIKIEKEITFKLLFQILIFAGLLTGCDKTDAFIDNQTVDLKKLQG